MTTDILNTFFGKQTWWMNQWIGYQFNELQRMKKSILGEPGETRLWPCNGNSQRNEAEGPRF